MKKFLALILSIVMLVMTSTAVFADGIDEQTKKLKVGICAEFKPFEYYDENGTLTGFDIDLMNHIGERIGYEIEYIDIPFDSLFHAIFSGRIDCAISAITVTEERDSVIDYSREYLKTNVVTYNDGELSRKRGEYYAIVFRDGLSGSPYDEIENPTDDEALYILIDKALSELSQDRTVEKLIEKYELNKPLDENAEENIEYSSIIGGGDPGAKTDDGETESKISATSVPYSDWVKSDIEKAQALNIINYGGDYNYPAPITREKFCQLVYNYYKLYADEVEVVNAGNPFFDTENQDVMVLNALGIINGKSQTEFAPYDLLTREEAAVILSRLINVAHPHLFANELYYEFEDSADISDWAMDSIQMICNMGIMNGVGENRFAPQETYTTEQAIATIVRVYSLKSLQEGFDDDVFKIVDKDGNIVLNYADLVSCEAVEVNRFLNGEKVWCLEIEISDEGRRKFKEATERVVEYPPGESYLAIIVDEQIISCPGVMEVIDSNTILVTGDFTETMAKDLANTINFERTDF